MAAQRIAALIGDFYHPPEAMEETLRHVAGQIGFDLQAFTDPAEAPWSGLGDFRGLIVARDNRIASAEGNRVWAAPKLESAISEFTAAGGALVALHSGLASYEAGGDYFRTVRGGFLFHPREHLRCQVRALSAGHPVLSGFEQFDLDDEMYFVRVDSARTTRLLEVAHVDYGTSCAAWAHEAGRGRVFCFTPGHTTTVLNDPGYRRFLENGLRWALRAGKSS